MATVYPFRQGTNTSHGPSRHLSQSFSDLHHPAPRHPFNLQHGFQAEELDSRLGHLEAEAREKFFQIIDDLPDMKMESWFIRQLDNPIIPSLTRIGFDDSIVRLLFQTAAAGWQRMGPFTDKCICFDPDLIKRLKSARNEIMSETGSAANSSWIILPRVYQFLEEKHSAYLWCYLNYLTNEPDSEFRRILTRIVIEFVGNYAFKYRSRNLPGCLLDSALFNGYAAMFWKNLRNPPAGFEDGLIFNHFLRWIKLFRSKCTDLNDEMTKSIRQMEDYREKVMLTGDALHQSADDTRQLSGLFITLRHGRPGMTAAIDFMGNWLYSSRRDTAGRLLSALLPSALNYLIHTIKIKFAVEPLEVQKLLHCFLLGLKENFALDRTEDTEATIRPPEQLRFVVQRVLGLVNRATASLA
jgi:hypothetical protein